MRDIIKGQAVRTNARLRSFFKTDDVIRGRVMGFLDRKTPRIRLADGNIETIHRDWLEPDRGKVESEK